VGELFVEDIGDESGGLPIVLWFLSPPDNQILMLDDDGLVLRRLQ
jgi:hypothetical protein